VLTLTLAVYRGGVAHFIKQIVRPNVTCFTVYGFTKVICIVIEAFHQWSFSCVWFVLGLHASYGVVYAR